MSKNQLPETEVRGSEKVESTLSEEINSLELSNTGSLSRSSSIDSIVSELSFDKDACLQKPRPNSADSGSCRRLDGKPSSPTPHTIEVYLPKQGSQTKTFVELVLRSTSPNSGQVSPRTPF